MLELTPIQFIRFIKQTDEYTTYLGGEFCVSKPRALWIFRIGEFFKAIWMVTRYCSRTLRIEGHFNTEKGKIFCSYRIFIDKRDKKFFCKIWPMDNESEITIQEFLNKEK